MRVFVTGGTGLLGNNVIRTAIDRGLDVVALCRRAEDKALAGIACDEVVGDLQSLESLSDAIGRIDAIIHVAAHIQIGRSAGDIADQINRKGTAAVVRLAAARSVPLLHVSTVNTLAIGQQDQPADEETVGDGQVASTYVLSKRAAEREVSQARDRGDVQATIVYPGFMLGPWDWKPSSGRMIQAIATRFAPMAPSGGCSVCDVRDVAAAIITILQQQRWGERYILAGANMTYLDLWRSIAAQLGRRGPLTILRRPGQLVVGRVSDWAGKLLGREFDTNSAAIAMGSQYHYYRSDKAIGDLGYRVRDPQESIRDSISWLREHGRLR